MENPIFGGSLSPEEFQRRIADFMKQQFQQGGASGKAASDPAGEAAEPEQGKRDEILRFDLKPKEVKAYLDRFVIRQDEAKKVLSVAICDHYHHVRLAHEGKSHANYAKQNIILLGPTGVGKTYLIRSIAELVGVPFVKADATKFSETGYVGGDVEDLVRELVRKADGDVTRAEYGIIYIDEIDKLAGAAQNPGRDVSGRGVQTNLLKLMEETEVPARSPQDLAGQMQSLMEIQRGKKGRNVINTRHILFIVSGAFTGLENIVRRRQREGSIGFVAGKGADPRSDEWTRLLRTGDFVSYGFEPEFIGRLPVRVQCHDLSVDDLFEVLRTSEGSIIRQYEEALASYGIEVLFREEALRRIAELGFEEETGARGLMTVCERIFRDLKFELPSTRVRRFEVSRQLVDDPAAALDRLLEESEREEKILATELVHEFAERFAKEHGLKIRFTDEAAVRVASAASEKGQSVREFCAATFKDFQFGLRLIAQNTDESEFVLDEKAVESPEKYLSEAVVASYRGDGNEPTQTSGSGAR